MVTSAPCPSPEDLKQFRLGRLPEVRVRQTEQHLQTCPSCLQQLPAHSLDDPLVGGLRGLGNRPRLNNPLLARAQQEVRAQPFRIPAAAPGGPAGPGAPATPGEPARWPETVAGPPRSPDTETLAAPFAAPGPNETVCSFLSPPQGPGELGRLGMFRVLQVLGEGGMGVVLQAEDTRLQRRVALKVMKPVLAVDPASRQRFLREARATAALTHDHIIAIHHIDEANGVPYLAMPLLQGETLDDRLRREGMLSVSEVIRIGREVAEGLAAAHEKGLIHRDIKPGNLWLEAPAGRVKVLDFGLAAMACPEGERTLPGTILGTPGYMAPEQAEGQTDHRADLFSLGCVLYRMATGRVPFKGETLMQKIRSTLFDEVQPPQQLNPALPAPLSHLIVRLLSRKPEERPATALAVARVLQTLGTQPPREGAPPAAIPVARVANSLEATVPLPAAPVSIASRPPLPRRWLMVGGGMAAAAVLLVVLLVAFRKPGGSGDKPRGPEVAEKEKKPGKPERFVRPADDTSTTIELPRDRSFTETWVTRPGAVEGLKGWCIETNDVGQRFPGGFHFTEDDRLLVDYLQLPGGISRSQFDPKTCGLVAAPFDGSYDALTPDARTCARVVTGGVQLWEQGAPAARVTLRSPGATHRAAFSPDGKTIVTLGRDSSQDLWFWDAREGSKLARWNATQVLNAPFLVWSPDSKALAVPNYHANAIELFRPPWKGIAKTLARPNRAYGMAWSPTGKLLATVEGDLRPHVIDLAGKETMELPNFKVPSLNFIPAWSQDGKELAFATDDKKVVVWDLERKQVTFLFGGHVRPIRAVAFLGDGRTLVSGSEGSMRFWDLKTNSFRGTLLNLGSGWLAISPDGHYRCSENSESRFVFKVREDSDRLREYSPDDFRKVYGWKNKPERVKLSGD